MPPKRKSTGARTAAPSRQASQQSTLSFNGKQSRVTKPVAAQHAKSIKKDPAAVEELVRTDIVAQGQHDHHEPTTAEKAIVQQAEAEAEAQTLAHDPVSDSNGVKTEDVLGGRAQESSAGALGGRDNTGWVGDEEVQARKMPQTQIQRYWRAKEAERLAPRVHQEELSVREKVLREWDMSGQYGPCIGIARLKRWKRANLLGLKPPMEVLAVLLKEMEGGEAKAQRAHVDELLSSRFIET